MSGNAETVPSPGTYNGGDTTVWYVLKGTERGKLWDFGEKTLFSISFGWSRRIKFAKYYQ